MLNPHSKFQGFQEVLKISSGMVQCFTSPTQAVMSQAETREPLKRVFIVIIPEYLFEFNGFRMNITSLIETNYSTNGKSGFGNSACDATSSFPSL